MSSKRSVGWRCDGGSDWRQESASICAALNILYKIFLLPLVSPVRLATCNQNDQDPLSLSSSRPLRRQMWGERGRPGEIGVSWAVKIFGPQGWQWNIFISRYYTIDSAGASTLSFNATSVQNMVILGLLVLVLGALILPLFGISLGGLFEEVKTTNIPKFQNEIIFVSRPQELLPMAAILSTVRPTLTLLRELGWISWTPSSLPSRKEGRSTESKTRTFLINICQSILIIKYSISPELLFLGTSSYWVLTILRLSHNI